MLRETWREDGRVRKRTLANLSKLSMEQALMVRRVLKGETLVAAQDAFDMTSSVPHGHVQAVLSVMRRLGVENLLASRGSRERSLVMALIAYRLIDPQSKLASVTAWASTSLPSLLGVEDANENDVYSSMDWLITRKDAIEKKLAGRHLSEGSRVMFDVSSSYVEGEHCSLAEFGHNRDKKRGKKQINWGLLTSEDGRPVALSVFPGSTGDPATLLPQVASIKETFKIDEFTLVGDRGMISGKHIKHFQANEAGVQWITALKSQSLRALVERGVIQPSLFDETNLIEFTHEKYPGERLIACRNPVLGRKRAHKRREMLQATTGELEKIQAQVEKGKLTGRDEIGLKVGAKLGQYKMGKHFQLTITNATFEFKIDKENVENEAAMDGIYVIRTNVSQDALPSENAVRAYKNLKEVEGAFRTMKGVELLVRPIYHRLTDRVKAHMFICMLAYYVRWHMERAWAPITFKDEQPPQGNDPVAPAERSGAATTKAQTGTLPNGEPAKKFNTVLSDLGTITRNACTHAESGATFELTTRPNPAQQKALDLLKTITL